MAEKTKAPDDKGMIRVMVYGTLKKGQSNHGLLEECHALFIGYDSVTGPFNLYDMGGLPAVMDADTSNTENRIRGELYGVTPEGLASLDLLEGHPRFYARRKLWTDYNERRAWVYFLMAKNFLPVNAEPSATGMWHGSPDESKFWLRNKGKAA